MEEEDLFDNGIDGEPWDELSHAMDQALEDEYHAGRVVYSANGVEFTACPADMNYVIITDKYHIYWWVGSDTISIYHRDRDSKCLLQFHKPFDLSFLATPEDPSKLPGEIKIIYSSAEMVNKQIERYLNLKAFM